MTPHPIEAHPNVRAIQSSLIREVANAGLGKRDVLPFWFGEPDEVTPAFIRDAVSWGAGPRASQFLNKFVSQMLAIQS